MSTVCDYCDGDGEVHAAVLRPNPFSGVPVADPQCEESGRCPRCSGSGVRQRRQRAQFTAEEMVQRIAGDLRRAA